MGLALYHMTISIIRVTLGISLGGSIAAILAILIPHEKIVGKITNITILAGFQNCYACGLCLFSNIHLCLGFYQVYRQGNYFIYENGKSKS